jgi:CubicO group peptidase (beta-lactamase class C family)
MRQSDLESTDRQPRTNRGWVVASSAWVVALLACGAEGPAATVGGGSGPTADSGTSSDSGPLPDSGTSLEDARTGDPRGPATPSTRGAIDAIVTPWIDPEGADGKALGMAVGVFGPSVRDVLGYGTTVKRGALVPDADTIFELGSITKVFTGLLLAHEVTSGRMKADDPVGTYLPAGTRVPEYQGEPIRLTHLGTHTSALPDYPDNTVSGMPNIMAGYTPALLYEFLARYQLTRSPGSLYDYSNLGFGLLGQAVSLSKGGATYDAMIVDLVGGPLGMKDTRVAYPSSVPDSRFARGYSGGQSVPPFDSGLEGGGGLRSTARDMVSFIAANVGQAPSELDDAILLMQEKRAKSAQTDQTFGTDRSVGFGIETRGQADKTYFVKLGGTSGFSSFLCFTKAPAAGVIVLANVRDFSSAPQVCKGVLDVVSESTK